ncbi:lipopolysaccharide biosynthesis protein [Crateriforma spongiae]|uniref:lipopolysaccharide biosynthesis protein n=1 Tax=Crateriforma spongiae TaxID=2724528 RepID=UPI001446507D|nr:polysaccharide biosynthesis C-terminal domain-containing protein [Crateriforma spongiae]
MKGTIATWIRLGVGIVAQVVATPVYLTFWSAEDYGLWIAVIAAVALLQIPGQCFQDYVGFELLQTVGPKPRRFATQLHSGVRIGMLYTLLELLLATLVAAGIYSSGNSLGVETDDRATASLAFLALALGSGLIRTWAGIWIRGAYATGNFARATSWGVVDALFRVLTPLIVLPLGANVVTVALTTAVVGFLLMLITIADLRRRTIDQMKARWRASWKLGFSMFWNSQVLTFKSGIEMMRQQGIRLMIAPVVGPAELTAFATTRTVANVAQQGLGTITSPMMPELMRFVSLRDQPRTDAAFATVWIFVVGLIAPGIVLMQATVEPFFEIWTRGKVAFDPTLFALLSIPVLVYALVQPATAVIQGNNLTKAQALISSLSGVIAILGTFVMLPMTGTIGVGYALMLAGIADAILNQHAAKRWLTKNQMRWPSSQWACVLASAIIAILSLALMVYLPEDKLLVSLVALTLMSINLGIFVNRLPRLLVECLTPRLSTSTLGRRILALFW